MPLIDLTIQHGRTLDEARGRLETAVGEVRSRFGALIRQVEWSADHHRVKLHGAGFWVELWVDARAVHATGDIPVLGQLLGGPVASALRNILQETFQKKLP